MQLTSASKGNGRLANPKLCNTVLILDALNLFFGFLTEEIQYHDGLRSRELGQAPMPLVFLTPRQALSSHPHQQMVLLYWLQDRDSMPNWYNINHPTTLHIHNETQWPNAAHGWHFALQDVSHRQNLATPGFPQCDHAVFKLSVDTGSLCNECKTFSYCHCIYFFWVKINI